MIILVIQCWSPKQFPLLFPAPSPLYWTQHPETAEIGSRDAEFFMRQERLDKILLRIGESALTDPSSEPSGEKEEKPKGSDFKCDVITKSVETGIEARPNIFSLHCVPGRLETHGNHNFSDHIIPNVRSTARNPL